MRFVSPALATLLLIIVSNIYGYVPCESIIVIKLENNRGGFFQGQKVTLTSKADGSTTFTQSSNDRGEAIFTVPCGELFNLTISNYTKTVEIESSNGGKITQNFAYAPDMIQKQKLLAMNGTEQAALDKAFETLPDTSRVAAVMPAPAKNPDYYSMIIIAVRNISGAPLIDETMYITGRKRNKTFKTITDKNGRVIIYLPKGDTYDIGFKYNKGYYTLESAYAKGTSDIKINFSYLGTKEIERRKKEEAERIRLEEERIRKEKEAFEKKCSELGLTLEECHKREVEELLKNSIGTSDTVIYSVMDRNDWKEKLIVCDVTGSMHPYIAQVALWYRLRHLKEVNLQFVLFNDGDDKADREKKIGETGGIYYSKSKGVDSLDNFMSYVQAKGYGGDAPENNMEALIKGVKMASPFKELVMIADNDAPVKDISLLESFKLPVHIIVCGATEGWIHPDYLKIARKTKGSIHTIEQDITNLARLSEGQQITIGKTTYRIMGGDFIELNKK
jgi:hypothetical protein